MTDEVPEILRPYLKGDIDFNALEDRLIPFAFNPQNLEEQDMVDLVFAEFYCVRDRTSDESLFRERIPELVGLEPDRAPTADRRRNSGLRPLYSSADCKTRPIV